MSRTWGPDGGGIPVSSANLNGMEADIVAASPALVVNQSGSSIANWTSITGTWASDGTVITQTNTSVARLRLDTKIPMGVPLVADVEAMLVSGSGADQHMGLLMGWGGATTGGAAFRMLYNGSTWSCQMEQDGVAARFTTNITGPAVGAWQKIRAVYTGYGGSLYVNGQLLGSANNLSSNLDASFLGLKTNGGSFQFRNLKVYTAALPALP